MKPVSKPDAIRQALTKKIKPINLDFAKEDHLLSAKLMENYDYQKISENFIRIYKRVKVESDKLMMFEEFNRSTSNIIHEISFLSKSKDSDVKDKVFLVQILNKLSQPHQNISYDLSKIYDKTQFEKSTSIRRLGQFVENFRIIFNDARTLDKNSLDKITQSWNSYKNSVAKTHRTKIF
jgi:hypothetical protein